MKIEFDPSKSERNAQDRGLPFSMVEDFDWNTALIVQDDRHDYGEDRFQAMGRIGEHVFVVVYTPRGDALRVISFRRANDREVARYEQA